ncbi:MAG TPA: phosphotransferase, partial [Phycisphaerales bacterium]|nr:phosphotransferase [Phycisphaerales bacterium]
WCHGDLHPGNLMRRDGASAWGPEGNVLLDFAETHPGHWVEDAVYLERIYWGRPQALNGVKPVQLIAKARRAIGLDANDDYATLANVRRVLMAATSPAFMHHEGRRPYLHAAIEVLEKTLPQVAK